MKSLYEFTVLNIGCFSRNKFWGEDVSRAHRASFCTSTWIAGEGSVVLVDPSLEPERMAAVIDARTGRTPNDVDIVFITHAHGDHFVGLKEFSKAKWFAPAGEVEAIRAAISDPALAEKLAPAPAELLPGLALTPLPGHTRGLCGIAFDSPGGRAIVSGDAVMNRDFFRAREGYYNSVDFAASRHTIEGIAQRFDIVIPGHDNVIWARV